MSQGKRITRKKLMSVLDKTLAEGGYNITIRSYNLILTRLGFRLGNYNKKHNENHTPIPDPNVLLSRS